jgi:lipid A 4'-phosphatase
MNYLRLRRSRVILGAFLLCGLLLSAFPALDIQISRFFFESGSFLREQWWQRLLKEHLGFLMAVSFGAVVMIYACNRLLRRNICAVDGRRVVYLLLVAIIGAGLIVNVAFKNHVGRARPRDVAEFGGTMRFTPPFVLSEECRTNCSFSSGDAAGAFFAIALAKALTRRRRYFAAAIAFGALVSFSRVSVGAHFFSDTVVSFFVMLIAADIFHYYVVLTPREREEGGILQGAHKPAYALVPGAPARMKAAELGD